MLKAEEKRFRLIGRWGLELTLWITALFVLLVMVLVIYAVFCRYVLHAPSRGISDLLTFYLMAWMTFLPAGWILTKGGHVRVGLVVDRLQAGRQRVIGIVTDFLGLIYSAVLAWYGWRLTYRDFTYDVTFPTEIPFPTWPAMCLIFIGGAILCLVFIVRIAGRLRQHSGSVSGDAEEHGGG